MARLARREGEAMTFDELLTEERIETMKRLDTAWVRLEAEARTAYGGGARRTIAAGLVRVGAWLDQGAVERAAMVARRAH